MPERGLDHYPIADDGTFEIDGVPAGSWEILLHWWRPTDARTRSGSVLEPPLAMVSLESGGRTRVTLDATPHLPGALAGSVTWRGAPVANATVTLTARRTPVAGRPLVEFDLGGVDTDDRGRFAIAALAPGDYHLRVRGADPASGNTRSAHAADWVRVDAGATVQRVFAVAAQEARVRLVDSAGEPLADRTVTVLHDRLRWFETVVSDADGAVTLDAVPAGALRLVVHPRAADLPPATSWREVTGRGGDEVRIDVRPTDEPQAFDRVVR